VVRGDDEPFWCDDVTDSRGDDEDNSNCLRMLGDICLRVEFGECVGDRVDGDDGDGDGECVGEEVLL
jgi:hypothetical protein